MDRNNQSDSEATVMSQVSRVAGKTRAHQANAEPCQMGQGSGGTEVTLAADLRSLRRPYEPPVRQHTEISDGEPRLHATVGVKSDKLAKSSRIWFAHDFQRRRMDRVAADITHVQRSACFSRTQMSTSASEHLPQAHHRN